MYRRLLRQPWIASPHIIYYVSQVRWRLRNDGQGVALPCPGALRRRPPRRYAAPLPRGDWTRPRTARGRWT
ncbi:MAG: hypothetical protein LBM98_09775 [Oscillospiraceae bacterium]|nr:hypothetical protein [Oscillospiraceae bacterium]